MARFVFAMNVSLDGYVDHDRFQPDDVLFRHWIDVVRGLAGSLYGRRIYEIMQYWENDDPDWTEDKRDFAEAWRAHHKWVVSQSLTAVGPNATLICDDIAGHIRRIKADHDGEIAVCGTRMAQSVTDMRLMDEYRLYYHPVVLVSGTPFFAGPCPPLRPISADCIGAEAIRLSYVPV